MNIGPGMETAAQDYLALPPGGSGPGVLVLHAWWGLNDFFRRFCDRLAGQGFVALAPDFYGGALAHTVEEAEQLAGTVEPRDKLARVQAGLERLKAHPAVRGAGLGVLGFSMGAAYALRLAVDAPQDVRAAVVFYGTNPLDFHGARAAFLGHFCLIDPWEPLDDVRAMQQALEAAGCEHTIHIYEDAGHWFMEDDRPQAYRPEPARLAWTRTLDFLHHHLDGA